MRAVVRILLAADHVGFALFHAAVGVVLGAAVIGPFEAAVILPALVGAAVVVVVVFAALARRARRRFGEVVDVRRGEPRAELARGDVGQHAGKQVPERNWRG